MKKLFTLTAENGDKLKIRVERNDDLSWRLDAIEPDFGWKPDISEPPKYRAGDFVYHIRDLKYVFKVKSASEMWLFSAEEDFINVIYCRPASPIEVKSYFDVVYSKKTLPVQKKTFRKALESFANLLGYNGVYKSEVLNKFLEQYED